MGAETRESRPALSRNGRAYVALVGWGGLALFGYCVYVLARTGVVSQSLWLVFAAATFASGRFTLKVPSVQARFSVSEMFAFTSVLLFGPASGAVTLALDSLIVSWRHRMTFAQTVFNFGNLSLAVWVSGSLFFLASGTAPLVNLAAPTRGLVLPLGLMAASYFAVNSGLIAIAIGLQTGQRPLDVWRSHFLWLGPGYAAGASVALLLVVAMRHVDLSALALLVPVLLVSYFMLRSSFGRLEDAKDHLDRLNGLYLSTIETLATAIDAKDDTTHDHVRRVQGAAVALTKELGYTDPQLIKAIEAASLLHDTGKIAVPEHILNKPGRLTPAEFEKMKLHAPIGAEILSAIDFPYPVVPIVRHHHESWDGSGYPDGLKGTDIPIGARIIAVVDCFDALTSSRPYRGPMSEEDALKIVTDRSGTMYDPGIVDAFVKSYRRIMPSPEALHPIARAVGAARAMAADVEGTPSVTRADAPVIEELSAFTSLSRAMTGEAGLSDLGALIWVTVRHVVPCTGLALFLPDERTDAMAARYAAGAHASMLRNARWGMSHGAVGWSAVNRRMIVNGEAMIAGGENDVTAPHWVCTLPLVHEGSLVAVLALYSAQEAPFVDQQAHLLELLGPRLAATVATVNTQHAAADPVESLPPRAEMRILRRA
jgi:putative nucleotidyltransferase with HDIG domain